MMPSEKCQFRIGLLCNEIKIILFFGRFQSIIILILLPNYPILIWHFLLGGGGGAPRILFRCNDGKFESE